jgi:hypothetical protein
MSPETEALDVGQPTRRWTTPVAVAASLVALICAGLLCVMVVGAGRDWHDLPWLKGPGSLAGIGIALWLTAALLGIGLGIVSLVLAGRRRRWATVAIALGVVSFAVVPATTAGYGLWLLGPHHPSDDELIGVFQQHQGQFQQAMAAFRSSGRVRGFHGLGIETGDMEGGRKRALIRLPVSTWGLVPSGSEKGYAYSQKPLRPTTDGETENFSGDMPDEIVYRHIDGPWYVYYYSW